MKVPYFIIAIAVLCGIVLLYAGRGSLPETPVEVPTVPETPPTDVPDTPAPDPTPPNPPEIEEPPVDDTVNENPEQPVDGVPPPEDSGEWVDTPLQPEDERYVDWRVATIDPMDYSDLGCSMTEWLLQLETRNSMFLKGELPTINPMWWDQYDLETRWNTLDPDSRLIMTRFTDARMVGMKKRLDQPDCLIVTP